MPEILSIFAHDEAASEATHHAAAEAGGISALGINLQSFLFQLITFVIVLLVLKRWVFPKLVATLEERRKAVEQSITDAQAASQKLAKAEAAMADMLHEARAQADDIIARSHKEATAQAEATEEKAAKRAERIVENAHEQMQTELAQARQALKSETTQLVAEATAAILHEKVDAKTNAKLIEQSLRQAGKQADASAAHHKPKVKQSQK